MTWGSPTGLWLGGDGCEALIGAPMVAGLFRRWYGRATEVVDHLVGWDHLPVPLGLATLIGVRERLQEANLHHPLPDDPDPHGAGSVSAVRTLDGTGNDVNDNRMGAKGTVFGRNVPIEETWPEGADQIRVPDPRDVSRSVLGRREFIPATSLNVLAAAWIQFQIRDWFRHGEPDHDDPWRFPIAPDDDWPADELVIGRSEVDDPVAGRPSTFTNHETHWWDASQVYGTTRQFDDMVRTRRDGKLALRDDGMLPIDPATLAEFPGGIDGWWVGLALLHVVFMREHNAICDRLRGEHPSWDDQQLYDHTRLVNAALIAKIHTVEWTPGILGHPTLQVGMRANWWGLAGERLNDLAERISNNDILSGIPGSDTDHHGVPYSLTEEFVTVYRMHPLIPDDYVIRSVDDDTIAAHYTFADLAGANAAGVLDEHGLDDLLYSLGVASPGCHHPAQLPHQPATARTGGWPPDRPGRDRHPAHPRTRCTPLQPLPRTAPPAPLRLHRRPHRRPAPARRSRPALRRRHRPGRHHRRSLR